MLRVGIGLLGEGKQVAEEGMIGELAKENSPMQTYISYLSVIGVCTPMIGLLGTVTGMIKAFAKLGSTGIGDPSGLSAAIGEVLVATASGLVIAIPAFGAFYFLRNRAAGSIHHIQDTSTASSARCLTNRSPASTSAMKNFTPPFRTGWSDRRADPPAAPRPSNQPNRGVNRVMAGGGGGRNRANLNFRSRP